MFNRQELTHESWSEVPNSKQLSKGQSPATSKNINSLTLQLDENLKSKLFTQIDTELDFCQSNITPLVCYNTSTPELKQNLVETIAKMVIEQRITISQAIIEVETLYSANSID